MTVVTMLLKAGMSPIANDCQKLFINWRIGLTDWIARCSSLQLLAVGDCLAIACADEVGVIARAN